MSLFTMLGALNVLRILKRVKYRKKLSDMKEVTNKKGVICTYTKDISKLVVGKSHFTCLFTNKKSNMMDVFFWKVEFSIVHWWVITLGLRFENVPTVIPVCFTNDVIFLFCVYVCFNIQCSMCVLLCVTQFETLACMRKKEVLDWHIRLIVIYVGISHYFVFHVAGINMIK